jgi:uncharacterized phage protein gp47/JayE
MTYGLTPDGFTPKTAAEILSALGTAQRASPALGSDWVDNAESPAGVLNGIIANELGAAWEAIGVVYASRRPDGASFAGLTALSSITGTVRKSATKGTVTVTLSVGAGRTIPAGSVAAVDGQPTNRWVTLESAVNSTGSTASVDVTAEAEVAGAYVANAGTITAIATPVTGWLGVTNASDAASGKAAELDVALRLRREREVYAQGLSTLPSVARAVRAVAGVAVATVVENETDTDQRFSGGLPPHSIEVIVQGGSDSAVAAAIWASKGDGIRTYGSTSATVVDETGATRVVYFTRPTAVNAYAEVAVEIDPAAYAGDAALAAMIANVTTGQLAGSPIRRSDLFAAARGVAGVIDCTNVRLGRASTDFFTANLTASARELLKLASGRVTVLGTS